MSESAKYALYMILTPALIVFSIYYYCHLPKFKEGDCFTQDRVIESWQEDDRRVGKILKVGKKQYLYIVNINMPPEHQITTYCKFDEVEEGNVKVNCPAPSLIKKGN